LFFGISQDIPQNAKKSWDILFFVAIYQEADALRLAQGPLLRRLRQPCLPSSALVPAPTLRHDLPHTKPLMTCPHECVAVADAVRRVAGRVPRRTALLAITSAPMPTVMLISSTPSPSLQQYDNINADLPTGIAAAHRVPQRRPHVGCHPRIDGAAQCPFTVALGMNIEIYME